MKRGESMIRTNIFLTEVQQRRLKALSEKTGAPVAVIVRRAIDKFLSAEVKKKVKHRRPTIKFLDQEGKPL